MKTRITEMLGIEHPIICGGMARIGTGRLPAAISNAGGLGMIGSGEMPGEILRQEIENTRRLTNKPFGVNLNRQAPNRDELLQVVCEEKPALVTIGGGDPRPCIEPLKKAGIPFFPIIPSLRLAKRLDSLGADGIVIEGLEAAGHVGYSTTMCLMQIIIGQVNCPVLVAGGIGTGKAMAAAFMMGADGIQMGTRFLVAEECPGHPDYKQKLIEANDDSTNVINWTRGNGDRVLKNEFARKFYEMELAGVDDATLSELARGAFNRGVMLGDMEMGSLAAGIICSKLEKVEPVKDIIDQMMTECEEYLRKAPSLLD